ncbi:MAG: hypothetical protein ACTTIZ_07380, partial [Treponema sp.]
WNSSTKEIIMPKDSTSFAKEKVRVWGRAKTTTDTTEELEVNTISVDPIVPTEEGIELIITTKASEKLQVGSVRVVVKKLGTKDLGERKDVVLTKITIKGQQANMLSNVVIFNPDNYPKNLKFTKDDVKVEGRAFGDTTSTALEVENIYLLDSSNPAEEIEVKDLGTLFAIKTKSTEKYNACFHGASTSLRMDDIILEYIKIGGGKDFKSEVEDGILVITVDKEYKDKEYTKNSLEFKIKDAMSAFIETKEVIPEKMKASNEGFGKKCIARIEVFFTNLEIPFYLRYKE